MSRIPPITVNACSIFVGLSVRDVVLIDDNLVRFAFVRFFLFESIFIAKILPEKTTETKSSLESPSDLHKLH